MAPRVETEFFQTASEVPAARREKILADINAIIAMDWDVRRNNWSAERHPFHDDHGLILASVASDFLGELIYRRLAFDGRRVIYVSGTDVHPAHRDGGIFRLMLDTVLGAEFASEPASPFYLCWRTRSPFVYAFGRALCDRLVPATGRSDVALMDVAVRAAALIFPDRPIEPASLIMRGVYTHMRYKAEPVSRGAPELNRWFASNLSDPADSVFCFGVCRNRWTAAI
jgi:hypothetical protein